jgi:hemerythrin-like metal-binding protein
MAKISQRFDSAVPAYIVWSDSLRVNNAELDDHHKRVLELVNQLYATIRGGTAQRLVRPILDELEESMPVHFRQEEEWMQHHQFPELEGHRTLHRQLARELNALVGSRPVARGADLLRYMKNMWTNHICGDDQQYATYILRRSNQHGGHAEIPPVGLHIEATKEARVR